MNYISKIILIQLKSKLQPAIIALLFIPVFSIAQSSKNILPDWAFGGFVRSENNPIISPVSTVLFNDPMSDKPNAWESDNTFNPGATIKGGKVIVLYRAEDNSEMGIGFHTSRIGYAESTDGISFKRRSAPVLYPDNSSQKEFEWPGGCEDPRVAVTQNGLYVLFYNGKNKSGEDGDMRYSPDSYCAGQVLFDSKDPSKPIARLDVPFLRPMEPFEKSGQYVNGTVFIEGMAFFKKKWHLYYGCADSRVGVAIYDPSVHAPPDPTILNTTP